MKISTRITIALLVAALLPLIVVGGWSLFTIQRASQLAADLSEAALTDLGQDVIRQKAEAVASEIELYLATHPEIDLDDGAQLEANAELAEIAVQPVGETGYTAVFDSGAVTHFHDNPQLIGYDLHNLAEQRPEFWELLSASLDGSVSGSYLWKDDLNDPGSPVRRKYMSIVPVGDTPLRVASTTYIEEFSEPANQVKQELAKIQRQTRLQLLAIFVLVVLFAAGDAYLLGRRYSQPIRQMTETAVQIADGDLSVEPPERPGRNGATGRHLPADDRQPQFAHPPRAGPERAPERRHRAGNDHPPPARHQL